MDGPQISKICITEVDEAMIQVQSILVFDWDNTLKQYDKQTHSIKSAIDKSVLRKWKNELKCPIYIISAIRPTKINMETILIEVERLELSEIFMEKDDVIQVIPNRYARKGNVVICGYDKAETFLEIANGGEKANSMYDELDGSVPETKMSGKNALPVVFFDDEEVNIKNFSQIVEKSKCFHVV